LHLFIPLTNKDREKSFIQQQKLPSQENESVHFSEKELTTSCLEAELQLHKEKKTL